MYAYIYRYVILYTPIDTHLHMCIHVHIYLYIYIYNYMYVYILRLDRLKGRPKCTVLTAQVCVCSRKYSTYKHIHINIYVLH